jgi:hypothetical protein
MKHKFDVKKFLTETEEISDEKPNKT